MLDRIKAALPTLPPAEQRVAKLVLADVLELFLYLIIVLLNIV